MAAHAATDDAAPIEGAFSDKILNRLAHKVGDEWKDIGIELNLTMADIHQIRADVPYQENHLVAVTFAIFRKWRSRNDNMSDEQKYNMLKRAFNGIEKQNLIYELDQLVDISYLKEAGNKEVRLKGEVETLRQRLLTTTIEAGNKEVRLRGEVETLRQRVEALEAQPGAKSHQQNNHDKKAIEDLRRSLVLKIDELKAQQKKDKPRHHECRKPRETSAMDLLKDTKDTNTVHTENDVTSDIVIAIAMQREADAELAHKISRMTSLESEEILNGTQTAHAPTVD